MADMDAFRQRVTQSCAYLQKHLPLTPEIFIQLGTGLGNLADSLEAKISIAYEDIPGFPVSTVTSHAGRLHCGILSGMAVAILQGRFHYYEGYSAREVGLPVRVLSLLGAQTAIITNASGGLNSRFEPGSIMILSDHINLLGDNPLRGTNIDAWGPRFPDLSKPYKYELQELTLESAQKLGIPGVHKGTYVCIPGPSLETPAETRFLKNCGADAVGMSSIPEIITAIHAGMDVLGLSVVANVNDPDNLLPILLDDIVKKAEQAEPRLQQLITHIISCMNS